MYKILWYSRRNSYLTLNLDPKVTTEGSLCTVQAVIKQIGADGVALSYVLHGTSLPCSVFLTMVASIAGPWCAYSLSISRFSYGTYIQAIAVYTFCVLVLRWNIPRYISMLVLLMIWAVIALVIVISYIVHMKEGIYGSVGYCKSCNFRL